MSTREPQPRGEGLKLETLLIASVSSLVAAVVVSQFWQGGTPIAAAVTPIVVALVSEGLRRPMQSEVVRRPVKRAAELSAAPIRRYSSGEMPAVREREPTRRLPPEEPARGVPNGGEPRSYNVYAAGNANGRRPDWRERLSSKRVRLAIVTGLLAFVVAAAALTLPELLFGGSVGGSDRNTTLFGGGGKEGSGDRDREEDRDGGQDEQQAPSPDDPSGSSPQPNEEESAPEQPPSEEPPPEETTPAPSEPLPTPPPETPTP